MSDILIETPLFLIGNIMEEVLYEQKLPFGYWILPMGILLLFAGYVVERNRENRLLTSYRYGNFARWWKRHFGFWILAGIIPSLILCGIMVLWDKGVGVIQLEQNVTVLLRQTGGYQQREAEKIIGMLSAVFLIWVVHSITNLALFLLLGLTRIRHQAVVMLLVMEGIMYIISYSPVTRVAVGKVSVFRMVNQMLMWEKGMFDAGIRAEVFLIILLHGLVIAGAYKVGKRMLKITIF